MIAGGTGSTADTATVFCTVIAVIAVIPCTPQRGEGLQVGLDARAAAGVRAGDRQHDGNGAAWRSRRASLGAGLGHVARAART